MDPAQPSYNTATSQPTTGMGSLSSPAAAAAAPPPPYTGAPMSSAPSFKPVNPVAAPPTRPGTFATPYPSAAAGPYPGEMSGV
eukprot:m.100757 g.100757  ORF g.100757 m.100757 type:complete len:83 (-) comp14071_c0_seq2:30-278(-)